MALSSSANIATNAPTLTRQDCPFIELPFVTRSARCRDPNGRIFAPDARPMPAT
jgi:hypothetical protein